MRNIACSLTTPQVRAKTKDVTRRLNWHDLKTGQHLMTVVKGMGLKPGEQIQRIHEVEVVSVRREKLRRMTDDLNYGFAECKREGFPEMSPTKFVEFFCNSHRGCDRNTTVTRIEWRYV